MDLNINNLTSLLFSYSYPISMVGAMFYSIISVVQVDILSIITNKNVIILLNFIIGYSGITAIFYWFNSDVPYIGTYFIKDRSKIKESINDIPNKTDSFKDKYIE